MSRAPGPEDRQEPDAGLEAPTDGPETVAEQRLLASLGRRARQVNLGRVVRLLELLDRADVAALEEGERSEAENLAHQVVGSAGTFGYPSASTDASMVEEHFAHAGQRSGDVDAAAVRVTLERLRDLFAG